MFTGLVEDCGTISQLVRTSSEARLTINTALPTAELQLGDSVAVNGACLTVIAKDEKSFTVDMSPETFDRTTFSDLQSGSRVNLERALRVGDRLGGHIVTGHIDTVGSFVSVKQEQNAVVITFEIDDAYVRYFVVKGSVAIDGISLTVNTVEKNRFSVSIIPHTLQATTLDSCKSGRRVNIETDILGKYVERFITSGKSDGESSKLSGEFLAKHGFM